MKKRQSDVPYDIIETILLQLPVKSLLRFKSVSRSWEATISDPEFAANHLQQSKKKKKKKQNNPSDDENLLLWVGKSSTQFRVLKLKRSNSDLPFPVLGYCDGLVLVLHLIRDQHGARYIYVLWNPSSRSYVSIPCHSRICAGGDYEYIAHGLYYDPLIKDYKIVVTDVINCYSIYQVRKNSWSHEMKEMEIDIHGHAVSYANGSSFEGDTYWVVRTYTSEEGAIEYFLVRFDSKEEKFEKFPMPISGDNRCKFSLAYLGGHLCLAYYKTKTKYLYMDDQRINQLWFVERVVGGGGGSSVEFKEALPFSSTCIEALRLTNENEIPYEDLWRTSSYTIYKYNLITKTCAEIEVIPNVGYPDSPLYLENMFFSSTPNEKTKSTG